MGEEDCQVSVCSGGESGKCLQVINMALYIIGGKCFTLHCTCHGFHFTFTPFKLSQLHTSCVQSLSLTLRFIAELPGWNIPLYVRRRPILSCLAVSLQKCFRHHVERHNFSRPVFLLSAERQTGQVREEAVPVRILFSMKTQIRHCLSRGVNMKAHREENAQGFLFLQRCI